MILSTLWAVLALAFMLLGEYTATAVLLVGGGFYGRWTRP